MTEIQMLLQRCHLPSSTMIIGKKKIDQQTQCGSEHAKKAME